MSKLVTIGIPVYTRFEYIPHVLDIVASQDYPNIELIISDNGMNGTAVPKLVDAHYAKPYRFRQNPSTVDISTHFNQLIHSATGDYCVVLADDDEITPNYVSELVGLLERHPEASVAMSLQQTIDESGKLLRSSLDTVPEILSGTEFIKAAWDTHEYRFESFSTFLAKTSKLVSSGGFPTFWTGTGDDDALMIKLSLGSFVAFSTRCAYRKRYSESSDGYAVAIPDLARGLRDFLVFLDSDPILQDYAASHPAEWRESRRCLVEMTWKTYYYRWSDLYRKRLGTLEWARAAFHFPFVPAYYRAVTRTFMETLLSATTAKGR
jgi:glycosyltransferase involved in cell wall biosynthesis